MKGGTLAMALAAVCGCVAAGPVLVTIELVTPQGLFEVGLGVAGMTAFRLSVRAANGSHPIGVPPAAIPTLFVAPAGADAAATVLKRPTGGGRGLKTAFGELWVDPNDGLLTLLSPDGTVLTAHPLLLLPTTPAAACAGAGPCTTLSLAASASTRVFGFGGGPTADWSGDDGNPYASAGATPMAGNTRWYTPSFWSSDGFSTLLVTPVTHATSVGKSSNGGPFNYPASWAIKKGDIWHLDWAAAADRVDLYLLPAPTLAASTTAMAGLTGPAAVPPRYAFGFLACRWGWQNRTYIEDTLHRFRDGGYPLDAFISDYGWFTDAPNTPAQDDFGYNPATFPAPAEQLGLYHGNGAGNFGGIRFGGIRKPRLSNATMLAFANASGWLLGTYASNDPSRPGPASNNLNMALPALRSWYASKQAHYLKDGVDFWWNDEGETEFSTYHLWNLAHAEALTAHDPQRRLFTLNRAYTPGMMRLGVAIWTGDISVSWSAFQNTPATILRWGLAGAAFVACDTGGFEGGASPPELLARWYQLSALMPVMRVHSRVQNPPHWPWLYGPDAEAAMRAALLLRYQLVPFVYSLAHATRDTGLPVVRPLLFDYPGEDRLTRVQDQWTMGGRVLAAPVLEKAAKNRTVLLPTGYTWFRFNTTATVPPVPTVTVDVELTTIPVYVRAGTVLPLAAPGLQSTANLTQRPLEVHIYPGEDGGFEMVEDDGETYGYKTGVVRRTQLDWNDKAKVLSWRSHGSAGDADVFHEVVGILFVTGAATPTRSATTELTPTGKLQF